LAFGSEYFALYLILLLKLEICEFALEALRMFLVLLLLIPIFLIKVFQGKSHSLLEEL
jgi:hypothetical protein